MQELEGRSELLVRVCLVFLIIAYAAYFSLYQVRRHQAFQTFFDLAAVEQTLWNTLQGRLMHYTLYPATGRVVTDFGDRLTENWLGEHVQPILLLLLPFYVVWPHPETLLIVMCSSVALGAVPFYRLAARRVHSPSWALLLTIGYMLLPAVETSSGWDLHGTSFLVPLLLAAFDAAERGKIGWWWFWSLLAMGTREDLPFLVGWGMLWLVPTRMRRQAWYMASLGTCLSVLYFFVVIPYFGGGGTPFLDFFSVGAGSDTNLGVLLSSLLGSGLRFLVYNIRLGVPLLFIYWLCPKAVLAALPTILISSASRNPAMVLPAFAHYALPVLPWLLYGALEGIVVLRRRLAATRWQRHRRSLPVLLLFVTMAASHIAEGYTHFSPAFLWPKPTGQAESLTRVLRAIPVDASLSVDMHLAPHVAKREVLRIFPDTRDVEWILVNVWYGGYPYGVQPDVWRAVLGSENWETVAAEQGLILLRRGEGPPISIERAFSVPNSTRRQGFDVLFGTPGAGLRLLSASVHPLPMGNFYLCTDWQTEGENAGLPWVAPKGEQPERAGLLHAAAVYPEIFRPGKAGPVRDCTAVTVSANANRILLRLSVRAPATAIAVAVEDADADGFDLQVDGDSLILDFRAPW